MAIDGASNLPEDQARVQALRESVGNDVQIMVDANQGKEADGEDPDTGRSGQAAQCR